MDLIQFVEWLWSFESFRYIFTTVVGGLLTMVFYRYTNKESLQHQISTIMVMLSKELKLSQEDLIEALRDVVKTNARLNDMENKYNILLTYFVENIRHMRAHGINPLPPPAELESDEMILKIFRKPSDRGGSAPPETTKPANDNLTE